MASTQNAMKPSGLASRLVQDQLISEEQARSASNEALKHHQTLVEYLVAQEILDSHRIAVAAADEFGVPLLDLDVVDLSELPINVVDEKLIRKHRVLPLFRRGSRLF
ncbi:MAG: type IV-A pilus assembly ATPase PilB, partial [Chromatiaceae bacterium]